MVHTINKVVNFPVTGMEEAERKVSKAKEELAEAYHEFSMKILQSFKDNIDLSELNPGDLLYNDQLPNYAFLICSYNEVKILTLADPEPTPKIEVQL